MVIKLYVSRCSGNILMKMQQSHIKSALEAKQIEFEEVDVGDPRFAEEKTFMQGTLKLTDEEMVALPPQIFNEKDHKVDYEKFFAALENEELFGHLDLEAPPHEVEYQRKHLKFEQKQEGDAILIAPM